MITSCGKKQIDTSYKTKYLNTEQAARMSLQPMLHIGESTTNLISRFGLPINKTELESGELSFDFAFSLKQEQLFQVKNVHGFIAWFTNNQLVRWDPIFTAP
jgi:hypothetical protein